MVLRLNSRKAILNHLTKIHLCPSHLRGGHQACREIHVIGGILFRCASRGSVGWLSERATHTAHPCRFSLA
jgi:hypothetical protein